MFEVVTDYAHYPDFNRALLDVEVVKQDRDGAEFQADRKTKLGQRVRAFDR